MKSRTRRLEGCEPLEKREMLSASGFSRALPPVAFDVAIRGTDVQYSPLGLPSSMGGDIYTAGGSSRIGHYQESLQPILMDINGDQIPDFVGTTGVATFEFFAGPRQRVFGSITTTNTSYIQGASADGHIFVGSQGTISGATGLLSRVSGGFVSQSTVGFAPTFEMQTNVHFSINVPIHQALVSLVTADCDHGGAHAKTETKSNHDGEPTRRADSSHQPTHDNHSFRGISVADSHRQDATSRHERSIDQNLEADTDWHAELLV